MNTGPTNALLLAIRADLRDMRRDADVRHAALVALIQAQTNPAPAGPVHVPDPVARSLWAVLAGRLLDVYGDNAFTAAEVVAEAMRPAALPLRVALADVFGTMPNPRKLGRALQRFAGIDLDGRRIEQIGSGRTGALWQVQVTR